MADNSLFAMFPGQGAQCVGMGKSLFDGSPLAKERFQEADEVLGFSLSDYCFEGPIEKLTETAITQPALLTVSVIAFELWAERNDSSTICAAAGHSLGEYSALVAAGALSFSDAVKLVHHRGTFMQSAVPVGEGAMIAVLGKEMGEIEDALSSLKNSTVEVANINAPGQVVLAGSAPDIKKFSETQSGWKIIELAVSAPFHCALMKKAEEQLAPLVREVSISPPSFPVIQNVCAEASDDPEAIRQNLISQVCGSVRWVECVQRAIEQYQPSQAIEYGAGKVLSGLLKRIERALPSKCVGTMEDLGAE